MSPLKVALFVEGTDQSSYSCAPEDPLARLWNERLCAIAGVARFDHVIGMSKRHLAAMREANRGLSGVGERFDQLLIRKMGELDFDAAVVAWDLHPRWNPDAPFCRWQETLDLYQGLADSRDLNPVWREAARVRVEELGARSRPSARSGLTRLRPGLIQVLCMDRMFETLLVDAGSAALKRAFEVDGSAVKRWPNLNRNGQKHDDLIEQVIAAVRRMRPKVKAGSRVRGSFKEAKHEWASFIIKQIEKVPVDKQRLESHAIIMRLSEIGEA